MIKNKKEKILEQILSESIWKYFNSIKKYFKINENYIDILFYALNACISETSYMKYLKNVEIQLNQSISENIKISDKLNSQIIIGAKNDIKAFINYKNEEDADFLFELSKILYLCIKKIEINEKLAKEVVFKQFIIDKNNSIILIIDKNWIIENYNLKALSFFKYDIRGKSIKLYLKERTLNIPKNSYDSFYTFLNIKNVKFQAKISSYKNEKTLIELISLKE